MLINKEGELLQEETEALRAQLSPENKIVEENGMFVMCFILYSIVQSDEVCITHEIDHIKRFLNFES